MLTHNELRIRLPEFKLAMRRFRGYTNAKKSPLQLAKLDAANGPEDMGLPGWKLHPLSGSLKGHWAVWVDQNWRMTFTFDGEDAVLVDYRDYH